ncbi:MAG: LysR family transcriptional regulator [Bdellovibrionales bacterium CG10_big_fil_rev_8_21_14_0_10_45_34]|nr:MAG: LysR family transcriptional regulator [Bdellovibrionales bacterium CG10_big_fil_rev_8_21_14_0_10_45_34]
MKIVIDGKATWINYHHLYCFHTIVLQGGLTKASEFLGIGQSALSIQMKQFEAQLGFSLFERSHRKMKVNERGQVVLSYAKEIFRLGDEMVQTLNDRPASDRVHVQIGALDTIPKHLTVELVSQALSRKSSVTVMEGKPLELLNDLMDHRIDLLLTNALPQVRPGQIFAKRIARLPLWVVGSKAFLKLKDNFPESIKSQPFILPTADSNVRHEFENFRQLHQLPLDFLVETQDIMVQKLLAIKGLGLSIMPEFAVKEFLIKRELFLIGKIPRAFEEIFLISAARKIENPSAAAIMRTFKIQSHSTQTRDAPS